MHSPEHSPHATLHARAHVQPHPDSEEAVQHERQRVPIELDARPAARRLSQVSQSSLTGSPNESARRNPSAGSATTTARLGSSRASNGREESARSCVRKPRWCNRVATFWTTQVCPSLEEGALRDHLALERTFLGYLRTSLVFAMTGVVVAQLFHLQRAPEPNRRYGFYVLGRPLSAVFIGMAVVVLLVGAVRFGRVQRQLLRGKTLVGGWEVVSIMGLSFLLFLGTFALLLGVDVDKTYFNG